MSKSLDVGGTINVTSGFTSYNPCDVYNDSVPWATGNPDLAGLTRVYVESVAMKYATGSQFPLITKDGVESAGGGWLNSGGTCRFTMRKTAANTSNFGRNSAASPTPVRNTRDSVTWNGCLGGTVAWSTVPTLPASIAVTAHPTEDLGAQVTIGAATDDGGNTITGYQLYYSKNGGAQTPVGSGGASGVRLVTGLEDGASYVFSVTTLNSRGESPRRTAGAYIPTSPSNINRYSGTVFEDLSVSRYDGVTSDRANLQRWNGSAWVDTE